MKPEPTDERTMLIQDILQCLGPNTSSLSRQLTKAELEEQSTEFLRATRASALNKKGHTT